MPSSNVLDFGSGLDRIVRALRQAGGNEDDDRAVIRVLIASPSAHESVVLALHTLASGDFAYNEQSEGEAAGI